MANVKNNAAAQQTRRKLIEAAGEVFAERGLHAATIKQITDRAGVNSAAINYHFKDKFELYAAVIRYALSGTPIVPPPGNRPSRASDRLRAAIVEFIADLYGPCRPDWRATLVAHEFAQPTAALDAVMEELIRPRSDYMRSIVRDIVGPGPTEEQIVRASMSIGAQCFLYLYQREIVRRLHPHHLRDENREELIEHIYQFSLAGLLAMRKRSRARRRTKARA